MTEDVAPRPVVRPAPDPARDARVAARREADRRRASAALDRFIADLCEDIVGGIQNVADRL